MSNDTLQGLLKAPSLSQAQIAEIDALVDACREHERLEASLQSEAERKVPGGTTNGFLYYKDGALIGIVTLRPNDRVELLGMVHPKHRRRGIGRALFAAAREECRQRGGQTLLLVCDDISRAGNGFAEAMGGIYRFSVHHMELNPTAFVRAPPSADTIALDRADVTDQETLARLLSLSMNRADARARRRIAQWFGEANQRFYIGRLADQAIGVLRAGIFGEIVYIASFGILPGFEGYGFGRQMLEGAAAELLSEGKTLRLEVETDNDVALTFYRSFGFKQVSTYRYYELQT